MPIRYDLHGRATVEKAVPPDLQAAVGRKKLSRLVKPHETPEQVQAELEAVIHNATGRAPLRIDVQMVSTHDARTLAALELALRKAIAGVIPGVPSPKIKFHKPRRKR